LEWEVPELITTGSYYILIKPGMGVDDYNSNGKNDLIMLCDRKAMLMCGVGNGTFNTAEAFSFTEQAAAVCAGDYNGDGSSDMAFINFNESIVSVLLHHRSGNFAAPVEGILKEWPDYLVSGDFTGDGRQDLMLVKNEQKIVVVPSRPAVSLTISRTSQSLRLWVAVPKEKPVLQWNPAKSDSSIRRFDIYRCTVSEGDLFVPITRVGCRCKVLYRHFGPGGRNILLLYKSHK